jgi:hypothetical protein
MHFCPEVKPGENRIIKCMGNQQDEEAKGNVQGRKISDECKEDMRAHKMERWVTRLSAQARPFEWIGSALKVTVKCQPPSKSSFPPK